MKINGLQQLTLVDYPGKVAATVFTAGCNMRCPYCHNASLVTHIDNTNTYTEDAIFDFMKKRKGKLDGICITGGEPLMQRNITDFIKNIKDLGFLVKLDTNGSYPAVLQQLIDRNLLDYVALDIKNSPEKYPLTVGIQNFDPSPVFESATILKHSNVPYELRTTLIHELHTTQDIIKIGELLKDTNHYYLQSFEDSGDLIGFSNIVEISTLSAPSKEKITEFQNILSQYIKNVIIRG